MLRLPWLGLVLEKDMWTRTNYIPSHMMWPWRRRTKVVEEEHQNLQDFRAFEVVEREKIPQGPKVLPTTWVMRKKASGRYKARITARGFEQREGEHYDSCDKSSPVVNDITIRIILVLIVVAGFSAEVVDVKGAFLTAEFDPNNKMYINVPKGLSIITSEKLCCS
jgi:hypothetical protein